MILDKSFPSSQRRQSLRGSDLARDLPLNQSKARNAQAYFLRKRRNNENARIHEVSG